MKDIWEPLRQRLMRQFRSFPSAEDIVQEALFRTSLRFAQFNDIENLDAFAAGVARNVIHENLRRTQRDLSFQVAAPEPISRDRPPPNLSLAQLDALKRKVLSASERKLFDAYFQPGKKHAHRERLAAKLGLSLGTLYVKMHRLKQRLIDEYRPAAGSAR